MIDLDKPSHRKYAESVYDRIISPRHTPRRRQLYLDMANDEEMRGNFAAAEMLRRFALKHSAK